jgi:PilZ domain
MDLAPAFSAMERRASVRHPATLRVSYRLVSPPGDVAGHARVQDISTLGVGLVLPYPAAPLTLLQLAFEGKTGGVPRTALARVVHSASEASSLVGCAFVRELDDAILRCFHAARVGAPAGDGRRWVRFPCNVETACYALDTTPGERSPARIVNISVGGAGLLLPCEFGSGTLLKLDLEGTTAQAAGQVLLRVVRVNPRPDGGWLLGCEFADQVAINELAGRL